MVKIKNINSNSDTLFLKSCATLFGKSLMWVNFLVIDNFFIDTGNKKCNQKQLHSFIHNCDFERDWNIINTHLHEDHCGNNRVFQNILNADINAPKKRTHFKDVSLLYRKYWGRPELFDHSEYESETFTTDKGKTIRVIPTPGHTPCHHCIYVEEEKILFTGDALPLATNKIYCMPEENFLHQISSIIKLKEFIKNDMTVIDGHHGILTNPIDHIDTRIKNMESVADRVITSWNDSGGNMKQTIHMSLGKERFHDPLLAPRISLKNTVNAIVKNL